MRINPDGPGQVHYFQKRRFYVPLLMDAYKEVTPSQVEEYLGSHPQTDRLRVQPADAAVRLPLRSPEDLGEVKDLAGNSSHKSLASQLHDLASREFRFLATFEGQQVEVGLYGAYNTLTDAAHGLSELTLARRGTLLAISSPEQLQRVDAFYAGSHPLAGLENGGYSFFEENKQPVGAYVLANHGQAKSWIGHQDEPWLLARASDFQADDLQTFARLREAGSLELAQQAFALDKGTLDGKASPEVVPVLAVHPSYAPMAGFATHLVEGLDGERARTQLLNEALVARSHSSPEAKAGVVARALRAGDGSAAYQKIADRAMQSLANEATYEQACQLYNAAKLSPEGKVTMAALLLEKPELAAPDKALELADGLRGEDAVKMTCSALMASGGPHLEKFFEVAKDATLREKLAAALRRYPTAEPRHQAMRTEEAMQGLRHAYQWIDARAELLETACNLTGGLSAEVARWLDPASDSAERLTVYKQLLQTDRPDTPKGYLSLARELADSVTQSNADRILEGVAARAGLAELPQRVASLSKDCDATTRLALTRQALKNPEASPGVLAQKAESEVGQMRHAYQHDPSRARLLKSALELEGRDGPIAELEGLLDDSTRVVFHRMLLGDPKVDWLNIARQLTSHSSQVDLAERLAGILGRNPDYNQTMTEARQLAATAPGIARAVYNQAFAHPKLSRTELGTKTAEEVSGWRYAYRHDPEVAKILRDCLQARQNEPGFAYNLTLLQALGDPAEPSNELPLVKHLLKQPVPDSPEGRRELARTVVNSTSYDRARLGMIELLRQDTVHRPTLEVADRYIQVAADNTVAGAIRENALLAPTADALELAGRVRRSLSQLRYSYKYDPAVSAVMREALTQAPTQTYGQAVAMADLLETEVTPSLLERLISQPQLDTAEQVAAFANFANSSLSLDKTRRLAGALEAKGCQLVQAARQLDGASDNETVQKAIYESVFEHPTQTPQQLALATGGKVQGFRYSYKYDQEVSKVYLSALELLQPSHPETVARAKQLKDTLGGSSKLALELMLRNPDLSTPERLAAFIQQVAPGAETPALLGLLTELSQNPPYQATLPAVLELAQGGDELTTAAVLAQAAGNPTATALEAALATDDEILGRSRSYTYRPQQAALLEKALRTHAPAQLPVLEKLVTPETDAGERRLIARALLEQPRTVEELGKELQGQLSLGILERILADCKKPLAGLANALRQQLHDPTVEEIVLRRAVADPDAQPGDFYNGVLREAAQLRRAYQHNQARGLVMAVACRSASQSPEKKWTGELAARFAEAGQLDLAEQALASDAQPTRPSEFLKLGLGFANRDQSAEAATAILGWLAVSTPDQASLYQAIGERVASGRSLSAELEAVTEVIAMFEAVQNQKDLSLEMDAEQVTVGDFTLTRQQD
ncbi:MAG: hypothetical protein AB7S38_24860 [Vulcanimicrobiota bacterium]